MQNDSMGRTWSKCPNCGKDVIVRSSRDTRAQFCSRICRTALVSAKRYRGTNSGPLDRPENMKDRMKI